MLLSLIVVATYYLLIGFSIAEAINSQPADWREHPSELIIYGLIVLLWFPVALVRLYRHFFIA
ncbi:MAG: hypothetical protein KME13_23295 [Myxacorys californica WJT36-NPBG1]|jgi:hypothetical protein|nr:hypothetical protein [Myxacorys californica WJT36-NPBG1]